MKGSEDMGTWKEYIDKLKSQWIGKEVVYENEKHRVVDVDYNGLLLIDKQPFADWKLEDLFQAIMQYGCKYDISKHIKTDQYRHELIEVEELCSSDPFRTRLEREQGTSQKA